MLSNSMTPALCKGPLTKVESDIRARSADRRSHPAPVRPPCGPCACNGYCLRDSRRVQSSQNVERTPSVIAMVVAGPPARGHVIETASRQRAVGVEKLGTLNPGDKGFIVIEVTSTVDVTVTRVVALARLSKFVSSHRSGRTGGGIPVLMPWPNRQCRCGSPRKCYVAQQPPLSDQQRFAMLHAAAVARQHI